MLLTGAETGGRLLEIQKWAENDELQDRVVHTDLYGRVIQGFQTAFLMLLSSEAN